MSQTNLRNPAIAAYGTEIEEADIAVAEELRARFPAERVRVTVKKSGINPAGLIVSHSAATAKR